MKLAFGDCALFEELCLQVGLASVPQVLMFMSWGLAKVIFHGSIELIVF